ncbi:MAG: cadherin-like beta sandwich domain-containing protein [Betaproteobacteria bacterium]
MRINGGAFSALGSGVAVPINDGANVIEVRVTAQDGVTVKSYTVVITRNTNVLEWASKPQLAPVPGDGGAASRPSLSANGRFVAFSTKAQNLVAGDTNGVDDVYVYDRVTAAIERVSVSDAGVQGNAASTRPSISANGRYVAFQSRASNLVPNDTNRIGSDVTTGEDIFVYDRTTKKIERVSLGDSGGEANGSSVVPSISGDGRFVAFASGASNLVAGFVNGLVNVYIRDRTPAAGAAAIVGIAVPLGNFAASRLSLNPVISTDGNVVAFEFAVGKDLDSTPGFDYRDIYAFNRVSGVVKRITGSFDGVAADGSISAAPSVSADGRMVAFHSNLRNLDFFDTNSATDVFVHDQTTGATRLASVDATGSVQCQTGACNAFAPALTGDGRRVVFVSTAPNLLTPATNGNQHVFMKDLTSGAVTLLSRDADAAEGNGGSGFPSASFDGRAIAFDSGATNLGASDANLGSAVFVAAAPELVLSRIADLASLTTSAGALTPGFSSGVTSYAAAVPETVTAVQVRANAADAGSSLELRINGGAFGALAGDASSAPLLLALGLNTVDVKVTAQNGTTSKTYTLNATRALSVDANLASLVPVADFQPALSPVFTAGTTAYTLSVPNETASIRFTPTTAQSKATIKVSGVAVTSGATSSALALALGANTITVAVTAQDGNTVRNYVVTVTRAAALVAVAQPAITVVEYINTLDFPNSPGDHFFYSTDPAEQAAVDSGAAGKFFRTGREFFTGGTAQVCRFYGSISPGPNSHFFTVDTGECNALRAAQITPTPAAVQQWNSEGFSYNTTPATIAANGERSCPANTLPLYRAYNNAYPLSGPKNPWDSNHRFTPERSDIAALVFGGWRDEGIVFCTAK